MNQYIFAFLTALVGIVGTGIGVLAAFVPTELLGKRDHYDRLAKIWGLLEFEIGQIITYSGKFDDLSTAGNPPIDPTLSPLSLAAWQATLSNGEFIGAADPLLLHNLAASYVLLEGLNAAVANYKLFCATTNIALLPNFGERVRELHKGLQREATIIKAEFEDQQSHLPRQIQQWEKQTKRQQRLITSLSIFALIFFSIIIAVCILLGSLLYRYG